MNRQTALQKSFFASVSLENEPSGLETQKPPFLFFPLSVLLAFWSQEYWTIVLRPKKKLIKETEGVFQLVFDSFFCFRGVCGDRRVQAPDKLLLFVQSVAQRLLLGTLALWLTDRDITKTAFTPLFLFGDFPSGSVPAAQAQHTHTHTHIHAVKWSTSSSWLLTNETGIRR